MTEEAELIAPYRAVIDPAWTDYNGHLNVAYFALVFDRATDHFLDAAGLGQGYAGTMGASTFVVEAHTTYLREVQAKAAVTVTTRLVGLDHKKIHYVHAMHRVEDGLLAATQEQLSLHVDLATRRSAPWPEDRLAWLAALAAAHARDTAIPAVGRSIRLSRQHATIRPSPPGAP
jgi:acyl-CoA thioester hydrolase